ncbi:MAG: GNAT family N-acetyltransferase [Candidatus Eisenbacteria bacterium]|nr:GNAT family N-acetyltransferase [Candidatus Eisenbacteria bacterium]
MTVQTWDTREHVPNGFDAAWAARLSRCRLANFTMDLALVRWEAARGKHARLALVEEGARRAALVLREGAKGYESGWPWRWQVGLEAPEDAPFTPSPEDARWLYARGNALAGGRRLLLHLPLAPAGAAPSLFAGATLVKDLRPSEDELLKSLDGNKRRAINKARREGYTVAIATTLEQMRVFAELHLVVDERHGFHTGPLAESPGPTEAWREWEHPWQTLWVAEREGKVVAGSGFGHYPGGMMDYRANASTPEALKAGANALLAWEALRQGRESGHRAMNWGGVTTFKQELRGERLESHCWLGGGALWALPNHAASAARAARARLASLVRSRSAKA